MLVLAAATLALIGLAGPDVPGAAARSHFLLLPRSELLALPTSGRAWDYMVRVARSAWAAPELDDQNSKTNVQALAAALVYARTGNTAMRTKARHALAAMIPTYNLSQDAGLGPARQIAGWVLVADFIGLRGSDDDAFRGLLRRALTHPIGTHSRWGGSLAACQEDSDNNWGAWCAASRVAAALYLGDSGELGRAARILRGFLGDRTAWSHFRGQGSENGALTTATRSWSCNAAAGAYVPTNPRCGDRSGAFPADAGRSGTYRTLDRMYQSETTAGVVLATELLYRNGYARAWAFRGALARIAAFDYRHGAWNLGSVQNEWPWLVNRRLGTSYPTVAARYGRSLGYTDWLYGRRSAGGSVSLATPRSTPRPTPHPTAKSKAKETAKPAVSSHRAPTAGGAGIGLAVGEEGPLTQEAGAPHAATSGSSSGTTAQAAAAASAPPLRIDSAIRQLAGGVAIMILIFAATLTGLRTRGRRGPAQGAPRAVGRRA